MNLRNLKQKDFVEVHIICDKDKNSIEAIGNETTLLTALALLVDALKQNRISEDKIKYAVKIGLEIEEEEKKESKKLDKRLEEFLKDLLE